MQEVVRVLYYLGSLLENINRIFGIAASVMSILGVSVLSKEMLDKHANLRKTIITVTILIFILLWAGAWVYDNYEPVNTEDGVRYDKTEVTPVPPDTENSPAQITETESTNTPTPTSKPTDIPKAINTSKLTVPRPIELQVIHVV